MRRFAQHKYVVTLILIFISAKSVMHAQQTGDDFKLKLKESLKNNPLDLKPELKFEPNKIEQQEKDVLKVSPTTKLPTKYDKLLNLPLPPEPKIDMNVTNRKEGPFAKQIDYGKAGVVPVPDARSIYQWINYTRGDGGASISIGDIDPVRAIQKRKREKRQKKINQIKQAYGQ